MPDLKLYYEAAVIKTTWYWLRNRGVYQRNMLGNQDTVANEYSNLPFDKPKDPSFWDKNSLFDKNCWENCVMETGHRPMPDTVHKNKVQMDT